MRRMARLVELRRIQEEAKAMVVGKVQARIDQLNQDVESLTQRTAQGHVESIEDVPQPEVRLPPMLYENFFHGQQERRRRLDAALKTAHEELALAMQEWQGARILLRQVEKLAQKEEERLHKEAQQRDNRQMDMIASIRHWRGEGA